MHPQARCRKQIRRLELNMPSDVQWGSMGSTGDSMRANKLWLWYQLEVNWVQKLEIRCENGIRDAIGDLIIDLIRSEVDDRTTNGNGYLAVGDSMKRRCIVPKVCSCR